MGYVYGVLFGFGLGGILTILFICFCFKYEKKQNDNFFDDLEEKL